MRSTFDAEPCMYIGRQGYMQSMYIIGWATGGL